MEAIRILHVVTYMGRGGLETMIMNYYRKIDKTKIQFDFLVHRKERADYDDEIELMGGKIYRLPRLNPYSKHYLKALEDFFDIHKEYKVVHSHIDCMSAIPLKAAKKAGVPIRIAHSHNTNQNKNIKYLLKLYYKTKIPKTATHLFACSECSGKWMFSGHEFSVIPNAIDAKKFILNKEQRGLMRIELGVEDNLVFGHIGRFNAQKNHTFLIDIFEQIHQMEPRAILILIGVGELLGDIKKKTEKKGLGDSVRFLGLRTDIPDLLQAMDVILFPSLHEGLPVTMIEAQAAGVPCLISDKVSIECKKTDLIKQLSLSKSTIEWANHALKLSKACRSNTYEDIVRAGYDIVENSKKLQNFYRDVHMGKETACLY